MKKTTFKTPMFRHGGFFIPLPNSIALRWVGFWKNEDHYKGDTIKDCDALNSLLSECNIHDGLTTSNWDKVEQTASEMLGGFGFEIVNWEKFSESLNKREQKNVATDTPQGIKSRRF